MHKRIKFVLVFYLSFIVMSNLFVFVSCKSDKVDNDENINNDESVVQTNIREVISFDLKDIIDEDFYNIDYCNDELYVLCDQKIYVVSMPPNKIEIVDQIELPRIYNYMRIRTIPSAVYSDIHLLDVNNCFIDNFTYDPTSHNFVSFGLGMFANVSKTKLPDEIDDIYIINDMTIENNANGMISIDYTSTDDSNNIYIIDSLADRYFSFHDKIDNDVLCVTFLDNGTIVYLKNNASEPNDFASLNILDFPASYKDLPNIFENIYFSDEKFTKFDNKELFASFDSNYIHDIYYDNNKRIWYYTNGKICYYSIEDNCIEVFYDISDDILEEYRQYPCDDLYISSDKIIATQYNSKMVYIIYYSQSNDQIANLTQNTTRILMNDLQGTADAENLKILLDEIYGIKTEIVVYPYDFSKDKIATKLLAGDTDFDLYCLSSEFISYYAKINACYDLSSTKEIVDKFDYMFDGIKELCSVGDKLCGVPFALEKGPSIWYCNVELAEKLGIDIIDFSTKKMTWSEFYDLSLQLKAKAETLNIKDFSVLAYIGSEGRIDHRLADYMTNYLDYDNKKVKNMTDEYTNYLNMYLKMINEGLIANDYTESVLFNQLGFFSYLNCDNQIVPQPLISADDLYMVNSTILAINPNSPNIDAAKKYLEYSIALPVLKKRTNDYFLKDWDLYEYYDPFTKKIEKREPKTNGQEVTAFILKNSKKGYYNWDIFTQMSSYIWSLLDSSMPTEEFAQKLYEKSKMIIEE